MILLQAQQLAKHFGPLPVLSGATLDVRPGQRLALVGPNGSGKTTLLKILAGQEEPDGGSLQRHPSVRIELLDQHPTFAPGKTVWDEASAAMGELVGLAEQADDLARQIAETEDPRHRQRLGRQYDALHHQLQHRDAYHVDHHIERVLEGLQFARSNYSQEAATLSGGQRSRLALARLLLAGSDLMLLDEPSNHLDLAATEWLEAFLARSDRAMIVVSHDRYLLDRVATDTLELFDGTVERYAGNFSAYWRQKKERLEVQRRTYQKQQEEIAKAEEFIRRHHYGLKHAQAEDRRKKLDRLRREAVAPPREIRAPTMTFPPAARCGDIAVRVERLAKGFGDPLFQEVSFDVQRGERWGFLGPNGCGKTTLLRCLTSALEPDEGRVILGHGARVGYFDQLLRCVDDDSTAVEAIRPSQGELIEPRRRDLLARFGITGDAAFQQIDSLSGGERSRVALARLAADEANLLILDEPTNHLDLWARDALERALANFDGTVIFVSHDRYFLNRVADHILAFDDPVRIVPGSYEAYLHVVRQNQDNRVDDSDDKKSNLRGKTSTAQAGGRPKKNSKPRRTRRFPYRKVADLEEDIARHETEIAELEASLGRPEVFQVPGNVRQIKAQIDALRQSLQTLFEHWEEAVELN